MLAQRLGGPGDRLVPEHRGRLLAAGPLRAAWRLRAGELRGGVLGGASPGPLREAAVGRSRGARPLLPLLGAHGLPGGRGRDRPAGRIILPTGLVRSRPLRALRGNAHRCALFSTRSFAQRPRAAFFAAS